MTPSIQCKSCLDKGFKRVAGGFEECSCRASKKMQLRLIDAGIREVFLNKNISDFKPDDPLVKDVVKVMGALTKRLEKSHHIQKPICFVGPRLSGKSLLASLLIKSAIRGGFKSQMIGLQSLSDIYFGKDSRYTRIEDLITTLDVLCLEVGQEFYGKIMGHLICTTHRYFRESGKSLIYTTPYSRSDMAKIYGKDVGEIFRDESELVVISTTGVQNAV